MVAPTSSKNLRCPATQKAMPEQPRTKREEKQLFLRQAFRSLLRNGKTAALPGVAAAIPQGGNFGTLFRSAQSMRKC